MSICKNIIQEVCIEEGISFSSLSKDWVMVLEKDNKSRMLVGNKFDLNGHALGLICDDKYALYEVLKYYNIPIVEHNIVYAPSNNATFADGCNSLDYLKELFLKYNKSVVLKRNRGFIGNGVYHIVDEADLEEKYNLLCAKNDSLSLSPFMEIENEYRVIMLNGNVELIYKKELPIVVGDGKSTLKELLLDFNYEFFEDYDEDNKDIILKNGEEFVYNWQFNLSKGARASLDINEDVKKQVLELAYKVACKVDFKFVSIDIIKASDNKYYVLEINSGVTMNKCTNKIPNGYNIVKEIYRKAVLELFKD